MGFFHFLKEKKFYKHLLIAILLTVVLFWLALLALDKYTRHGEVYKVPDFKGKTVAELEKEGMNEYFQFIVIDSVYDKNLTPGSVLMQNPEPGSTIKKGRRMYLTIVAVMPDKVEMPDLRNLSLRQALVTLEVKGLKAGNLKYVDYFARNAVIDQMIDDEPVDPGTEIYKGTKIDLVVGKGKMTVEVPVPFIVGETPEDAERKIHYASLNIGKQFYMDDDRENARVYKTEPPQLSDQKLNLGDTVDVWYRSAKDFDFDNYIKEMLGDTLPADSLNNLRDINLK